MLIDFLGTGAAEGIPAIFCRCAICENARRVKNKEIRMRTGVVIDKTLLIAFSPDSLAQSLRFGIDYSGLQTLLVTHTHADHFAVEDLLLRAPCNSKNRTVPTLNIYGNSEMAQKLNEAIYDNEVVESINVITLRDGEVIQAGEYRVQAFKTIHMETEESLMYLISKDGKTYLHALDSAEPLEETYELLSKTNAHIDVVSFDCTFGLLKEEFYGHMNFWQNLRVKQRLEEIGAVDTYTRYYLTHISHYAGNTQNELEFEAKRYGFEVAYDGLHVLV